MQPTGSAQLDARVSAPRSTSWLVRREQTLSQRSRVILVAGTQGVGLVLRSLAMIIAGRNLGTDGVGLVASVIAVGSIMALPSGLGLKNAAIYFLPKYAADGLHELRETFVRSSLKVVGSIATLLLLTSAAIAIALRESGEIAPAFVVLSAAYGAGFVLTNLLADILKADDHPVTSVFVVQGVQPALLVASVSLAVVVKPTWEFVALGFAFAALVAATVLFFATRREKPEQTAEPRRQEWLSYSMPLLISGASLMMLSQAPVLVVGWLAGASESGGYAVAYRLGALPALMTAAVNTSMAPRTVRWLREGKLASARRNYKRILTINFGIVAVCTMFIVLFRSTLLGLYGDGFVAFDLALVILVAGIAVSGSVGPVAYMLTALGRNWDVVVSYGIVAVMGIIATAVGASVAGATGAAWAIGAAMVAQTLTQALLLMRAWPRGVTSPSAGAE